MSIINHLTHTWKRLSRQVKRRLFIMFAILVSFNVMIWVLSFFLFYSQPLLIGLVALAYGLGLRHAVDADHIAAIDNTTRKLMREGQRPLGVGFFFSLGHSTIVILLSFFIATAGSFIKHYFFLFNSLGFYIGTSISSLFLLFIGILNLIVFSDLIKHYKKTSMLGSSSRKNASFTIVGPLSKFLSPLLRGVRKSWHMYYIGFLFGLGFDTASEVGLLSLSALNGISGASYLVILLLPFAFTAGMVFIDTLDGVLMLGVYGWAYIKPERKMYYNLTITLLSVFIAFFVGIIQIIGIFSSRMSFSIVISRVVTIIDFEKWGYLIILAFLLFWIISWGIYKFKKIEK